MTTTVNTIKANISSIILKEARFLFYVYHGGHTENSAMLFNMVPDCVYHLMYKKIENEKEGVNKINVVMDKTGVFKGEKHCGMGDPCVLLTTYY